MLLLTFSFNAYELLSVIMYITYTTCFVKLLLCYINH